MERHTILKNFYFKVIRYIIGCFFIFYSSIVYCQKDSLNNTDSSKVWYKKISILPSLYTVPEMGVVVGIDYFKDFRLDSTEYTRVSNIGTSLFYSLRNFAGIQLYFNIYSKKNKWFYNTNSIFQNSIDYWFSQDTSINDQKEIFKTKKIDFPLIILRKIKNNYFLGVKSDYSYYNVYDRLNLNSESHFYDLSKQTTKNIIGLGLNCKYDSRNSIFFPKKGFFVDFLIMKYNSLENKSQNFNLVQFNTTKYVTIRKKLIVGFNNQLEFEKGDAPFYKFLKLGGVYHLRGFHSNKYIGLNRYLFQFEIKYPLPFFDSYLTSFFGISNVTSKFFNLFSEAPHYSYGMGYNIPITKNGQILRFDFASGDSNNFGFYIGLGSVF